MEFSVKNFGPFRDKVTLNMQATVAKERPENLIQSPLVDDGVLTSAAIFGANSSGKSYLFRALSSLQILIFDVYEGGFKYPWHEPFRLSTESLNNPTEFNIQLILDDGIYDYSISHGSDEITRETLYVHPVTGYKKRIFERDVSKNAVPGGNKDILKMTSRSSAYLTVGSKFNDAICNKVRKAILDIIVLSSDCEKFMDLTYEMSKNDPEFKKSVLKALCAADLGITDLKGDRKSIDAAEMERIMPPFLLERMKMANITEETELFLRHDFNEHDVSEDMLTFPLDIESNGTKQLLGMMGPISDALINGKTVLIDEFGSYLHPMLTRWVIEQFKTDKSKMGAQLIVNTHDLSLMDIRSLLRRDQIFFTDKDRINGSSSLYSLSDFKGIRKDTDALKAYLLGRFDAIPDVSTVWRT